LKDAGASGDFDVAEESFLRLTLLAPLGVKRALFWAMAMPKPWLGLF
jgi:hypothetical protein